MQAACQPKAGATPALELGLELELERAFWFWFEFEFEFEFEFGVSVSGRMPPPRLGSALRTPPAGCPSRRRSARTPRWRGPPRAAGRLRQRPAWPRGTCTRRPPREGNTRGPPRW